MRVGRGEVGSSSTITLSEKHVITIAIILSFSYLFQLLNPTMKEVAFHILQPWSIFFVADRKKTGVTSRFPVSVNTAKHEQTHSLYLGYNSIRLGFKHQNTSGCLILDLVPTHHCHSFHLCLSFSGWGWVRCFTYRKLRLPLKTRPLTHLYNSTPVNFTRLPTVIFSSAWHRPKSSKCGTSSAAASTIVPAGGSNLVGPRFHLLQLFWPSAPINAISSLFLTWESGRRLWNNPTPPLLSTLSQQHAKTHKHLTGGQRVGTSVGTTHRACSASSCALGRTCAMGNVQPPKKEEGIHFLADPPLLSSASCSPWS